MFHCEQDEETGEDDKTDALKHHINECVNSYTSYILVDKVLDKDYYASSPDSNRTVQFVHGPKAASSRIVSVMICEMNIHVQHQHHHCCLIHYLCTHPSMRQRGYASTLIKSALKENGDLYNNKIYCVTS